MNRVTFLAAIAAATVFASPALAQGNAAPAAPAGFRIEAIAGYDHLSVGGYNAPGVLYGVGAGFDLPVGNGVSVGVDGEISSVTAHKHVLQAGRDVYAGGRASFAVSPRANLYVKGGYANARERIYGLRSRNINGFRLGAGGQYLVSGKAYVGAEYRYSKYGDYLNYQGGGDRHQFVVTVGSRF